MLHSELQSESFDEKKQFTELKSMLNELIPIAASISQDNEGENMGLTGNAIFHDDVSDASSDYSDSNQTQSSLSGDSVA